MTIEDLANEIAFCVADSKESDDYAEFKHYAMEGLEAGVEALKRGQYQLRQFDSAATGYPDDLAYDLGWYMARLVTVTAVTSPIAAKSIDNT